MNFTAISLTWFQSDLQTSKHHGYCCWQLFTSKIRCPASHCWHLCHHSICLQCCVFLQRGQHSRRLDKRFKSLCLKVVFVHLKTANQPLICSKSRISTKFYWKSKLQCWKSSMFFSCFRSGHSSIVMLAKDPVGGAVNIVLPMPSMRSPNLPWRDQLPRSI